MTRYLAAAALALAAVTGSPALAAEECVYVFPHQLPLACYDTSGNGCTVNTNDCDGGHCTVNTRYCGPNGHCTVNAGECLSPPV